MTAWLFCCRSRISFWFPSSCIALNCHILLDTFYSSRILSVRIFEENANTVTRIASRFEFAKYVLTLGFGLSIFFSSHESGVICMLLVTATTAASTDMGVNICLLSMWTGDQLLLRNLHVFQCQTECCGTQPYRLIDYWLLLPPLVRDNHWRRTPTAEPQSLKDQVTTFPQLSVLILLLPLSYV